MRDEEHTIVNDCLGFVVMTESAQSYLHTFIYVKAAPKYCMTSLLMMSYMDWHCREEARI